MLLSIQMCYYYFLRSFSCSSLRICSLIFVSVLQSCSSHFTAAKETCCQPHCLFSPSASSPLFFIAHGLREQLAFRTLFLLCERTLIGWPVPQKQSSMGCRQPARAAHPRCQRFTEKKTKTNRGKNKGSQSSGDFAAARLVLSLLRLRSCNENQSGSTYFLHFSQRKSRFSPSFAILIVEGTPSLALQSCHGSQN